MSYQTAIQLAKHKQEPLKADRFVKISDREYRSDLPEAAWKNLLQNNYLQTWKGIILAKGITEITLYPMLLHELQPKTIIEIGAFNGGSAIWFADLMEMLGIESRIYSMDINLFLLDEKAKDDQRVQFIQGDSNQIESVFTPELLSTLPHPWFVTEDAHVNSVGILEYFHKNGFESGDYIIIEDTNPFMWKPGGKDEDIYWNDTPEDEMQGESIMADLQAWLKNHEDEYLIDSYYLDLFGYNVSKNWNSVLKKV
ncbi:MAG: cephalosporin hydroxylase [Moorea sp. SIO3C2]|nr:cephalosporin hydroxylase [Moorena sp. SIO3C2]